MTPEEILEDGTKLTEIKKGMDITFKIAEKVRENDKLYLVRAVKPEVEI